MSRYWFQTAGGRAVDYFDPTPEMITLGDLARHLARLPRFLGATRGPVPYSVAQHSVLVSYHVPPEWAPEGLFHDAAEAYTGDLPTPLKWLLRDLGQTGLDHLEDRLRAAVWRRFGLRPGWEPHVKPIDEAMYATERRDVAPLVVTDRDDLRRGVAPLENVRVVPWNFELAEGNFIARWNQLQRSRP